MVQYHRCMTLKAHGAHALKYQDTAHCTWAHAHLFPKLDSNPRHRHALTQSGMHSSSQSPENRFPR